MSTEVAKKENQALAPTTNQTAALSPSERFTGAILKEFSSNAGEVTITNFQKKLCQNYFIKLDSTLKELEQKRLAKSEKYREAIPYTWDHVNMSKLAQDVIAFSSIGLDPCQKNHVSLICYANSKTSKYDVGFMVGYVGLELKAKKYGYEMPDDVVIEVVFQNEKFTPIKKDKDNPIETYILQPAENPFNKGEVVGGFYYYNYLKQPEKNKLRVFSLSDILKRRPEKASAEFWGGKKDVWEDNKKVGTKEIEGWFEEMCYKTIARSAYDAIAIDSQKIDENFLATVLAESEHQSQLDEKSSTVQNQISSRANQTPITMDPETVDTTHEEVKQIEEKQVEDKSAPAEEKKTAPAEEKKNAAPPRDGELKF